MALDILPGHYDHDYDPAALTVVLGNHQAYIGAETMQEYIPAFRHILRHRHNHAANPSHLIRRSKLVRRNVVSARFLTRVWEKIIASLEQDTLAPGSAAIDLMDGLKDSYAKDLSYPGQELRFSQTLQLFQCLAEISRQVESTAIGSLLSQFFIKYGRYIAQAERYPDALLHWGAAIFESAMSEGQMVICCRELLMGRPELRRIRLDYGFRNLPEGSEKFLRMLQQVAYYVENQGDLDDDLALPRRGRSQYRGGRGRRYGDHRFPYRDHGLGYSDYSLPGNFPSLLSDRQDPEARLDGMERDLARCLVRLDQHERRLDSAVDPVPYYDW